ncbi:MAG: protein kinase domain-containing protein [Bradymonadia bacterium]
MTTDFSASDLIGTVIDGRFEVMEKLGEGGMGAIYKARQLSMERMVALKILLRNRRGDPISVERFRHEAYLASRLRHPNAVVIYDFGKSDAGLLYIAMELLAGQNLKQRLRETGPMGVTKAVRVLRQNLRPISQAHRMGLIHRDLKPANIFLTTVEGDADFVKVLDFGVAKLTAVQDTLEEGYQGGLTVAGKIYGTPNYMSPEQIRGKDLNNQSDLYSLGTIFYEMLCGRRPFEAETPVDVMMMHLRDDPVPPSQFRNDLPEGLEAVVLKALAKDQANRFKTGEEFLEALEPYRTGLSAEHATFGFDKSELEDLPDEDPDEPVLSGLDFSMDGLGSMLDDLNEEKTVLDTGDDLSDADMLADRSEAEGDERTVFESFGSLGVGQDEVDALGLDESEDLSLSVSSLTSDAVIETESDDDSGLSVLELGTSDFDRLEPSLMVDIPKMEERVAPASRVEQKRTMMGFPGAGDLAAEPAEAPPSQAARPVFPTAKPVQNALAPEQEAPSAAAIEKPQPAFGERPEQSPKAQRDQAVAPKQKQTFAATSGAGQNVLAGSRDDKQSQAGAFELPSSLTQSRTQPKGKRRTLKGFWVALSLVVVIGMGGFLVIWQMSKQKAKPAGPPSIKVFSSSKHDLLLNGLFSGNGRLHKLKKGDKSPTLQVSKKIGGKGFVKLALGEILAPTAVYLEPPKAANVEKLGKVEVKGGEAGRVLKVGGQVIEATRLLLVGEIGAQISVQVGDKTELFTIR